jgi:hypothetical protein
LADECRIQVLEIIFILADVLTKAGIVDRFWIFIEFDVDLMSVLFVAALSVFDEPT